MNAILLVFFLVMVKFHESQSQFLLPKLFTNEVKKIASNIGLIKTTPTSPHSAPDSHHIHSPPAVNGEQHKPDHSENSDKHNVNKPIDNNFQSNGNKQDATSSTQNNVNFDIKPNAAQEKPSPTEFNDDSTKSGIVKSEQTPASEVQNFPPGPSVVKNNATSINKDGSVVFPEDEHNPNATVIKPKDCKKGVPYPPNDPCAKMLGGIAQTCPPGTVRGGDGCVDEGL